MRMGVIGNGAIGREHFRNAANHYRSALAFVKANGLEEAPEAEIAKVLSALYTRIAWFSFKTNMDRYLAIDSAAMVEKALEWDAENALALWASVEIRIGAEGAHAVLDSEFAMTRIQRALEIKPAFPEALLLLNRFNGRRDDRNAAQIALDRFLDCLEGFSPELSFYDTAYPAVGHMILIAENTVLERKNYRNDDERFALRWTN